MLIGVPSGIIAAAYQGSSGIRALMLGALLGVCVPGFWLSLNFIYLFAVRLGWLPVAGYASIFQDPLAAVRYMVLPAVSLGFNQSALIARIAARACWRCCSRTTSAPRAPRASPQRSRHLGPRLP